MPDCCRDSLLSDVLVLVIVRTELHYLPHGLELIRDKHQHAAQEERERIVFPLPGKRHQAVLGIFLVNVVNSPDHAYDAEGIEGLVKDACMNYDFHVHKIPQQER